MLIQKTRNFANSFLNLPVAQINTDIKNKHLKNLKRIQKTPRNGQKCIQNLKKLICKFFFIFTQEIGAKLNELESESDPFP